MRRRCVLRGGVCGGRYVRGRCEREVCEEGGVRREVCYEGGM